MSKKAIEYLKENNGLPIDLVNSRNLSSKEVETLKMGEHSLTEADKRNIQSIRITKAKSSVSPFKCKWIGPIFSLLLLIFTFVFPVFLSHFIFYSKCH